MAEVVILPFDEHVLEQTRFWLRYFADEWVGETPLKIHTRDTDDGHGLGGPAFHYEFVRWLGPICNCPDCIREDRRKRNAEGRLNTTRAFRKLRKVSPREFDALYCYVVLRMPLENIVASFNNDAERLNKTERYNLAGILTLIVLGTEKVRAWWGS